MKLTLKSSGGFANIEIGGNLDTVELPAELAQMAEKLLTSENLAKAGAAPVDPYVADAMLYEVTIQSEGDEPPESYLLNESTLSAEMGDALSLLMREVVRRRVEGGAAGAGTGEEE